MRKNDKGDNMSRQLTYDFDELPLIISGNIEAGLVHGSALISYWPAGEWGISEIYLDGYQVATNQREPYPLERGTSLYETIFNRLIDMKPHLIQDAVHHALDDEREGLSLD
jgi:hypothetical protein